MKKINSFIIAFIACLSMACEDEVVPDVQAPTVEISAPEAETSFSPDDEISIRATVKDDIALESVNISVNTAGTEKTVLQTLGRENFSADQREATLAHTFLPDGKDAGKYTFTIEARDRSGNTTEKKLSVLIRAADNRAPGIAIHAPEDAAEYYEDDLLHLQAHVSDASKIEYVTVSLTPPGGEPAIVYTVAEEDYINDKKGANIDEHIALGTSLGEYTLTIEAKDIKANMARKSITVVMREPDTDAPAITIHTPEEGKTFYPDDAIPFEAHVADEAALESVNVSISAADGTTIISHRVDRENFFNKYKEVNINKAFSLGNNPAPGTYTFKVQALDIHGNIGEESTSIEMLAFNPNAPAISILIPEEGAEFMHDDEINFQANILDDNYLESVSVSLKGPGGQSREIISVPEEDIFNEHREADINETLDLGSEPAPGTYTITVEARDKDGNTREKSVRITIQGPDTSAPVITINSPAEGTTFRKGSEVNLDAVVEDDRKLAEIHIMILLGGVATVYEETFTEFDEDTRHQLQETATIPTDAASGSYLIIITATDAAGNVSEETMSFQVTGS